MELSTNENAGLEAASQGAMNCWLLAAEQVRQESLHTFLVLFL